jgi:hypothetical protein
MVKIPGVTGASTCLERVLELYSVSKGDEECTDVSVSVSMSDLAESVVVVVVVVVV